MDGLVCGFVKAVQRRPQPQYRKVFGEAVRANRKEAGLTQEKLAKLAGLHHNFIGTVERGNMDCSLNVNGEDRHGARRAGVGFGKGN